MSEKYWKARRYEMRLAYIRRFCQWARREPPIWKLPAWIKWLRERPEENGRADK